MNAILLSLVLIGQIAEPVSRDDLLMIGPQAIDRADLLMAGPVTQLAATESRVLDFYGPSWCPACPAALETVNKELGKEFKIRVHKDYETYPDWVVAQGQNSGWGYPMLHWTTNNGPAVIMVWSGIQQFRKQDGTPKKNVTGIEAAAAPTPGKEVERVIGLLPTPIVGFVDFGCGADARWCVAAAERWSSCRITGIEIDPARAAAARERVHAAGLSHRITIVTGDATTTDVEADVGVAFLYQDVLEKLKPRIEKLRAFASYMHRPAGIPVTQNGDSWLYFRSVQAVQQTHSAALWQGQYYSQPVCSNPGCAMCRSIRSQLNGMPNPPKDSVWRSLF